MDRIVSTAKMIQTYLLENGFTLEQLADASRVSSRTIRRLLNDESKLSYDVAKGVNALIPEISVEFLLGYDLKYQVQKREVEESLAIDDLNAVVEYFKLKDLYPEYRNNKKKLVEIGANIFGRDNLIAQRIACPGLEMLYSKSNGAKDCESFCWTIAAYREFVDSNEENVSEFDKESFLENFKNIKKITGATSYESAIVNIRMFCESCGINFSCRNSIPNARIKGVCIRDDKGRVFIFLSNLFKCVESLLVAFVHECFHLLNDDFDRPSLVEEGRTSENERMIDKEVKIFFVGDSEFIASEAERLKAKDIYKIANMHGSAPGIVAFIARCESKVFNNYYLNSLLHYYKTA